MNVRIWPVTEPWEKPNINLKLEGVSKARVYPGRYYMNFCTLTQTTLKFAHAKTQTTILYLI